MTEFRDMGKIARLNRDIVITEKLDGTNVAVIIEEVRDYDFDRQSDTKLVVSAQSRNRILTPGNKGTDNYGFAQWVQDNAEALKLLGPGYHYGEWYGYGINRNYGLKEKRLALFNVLRWQEDPEQSKVFKQVQELIPTLELVPLLYRGPWVMEHPEHPMGEMDATEFWLSTLKRNGSVRVPCFQPAEGIVVFHTASRQLFKATCEKDEERKGPQKKEEHDGI